MDIVEVKTRSELRKFVTFPDSLYAGCPQYVPALHKDQIDTLTKNPALEYCTQKLWMAVDEGGKVYGRICAIVNPRYNERYGKKCCRFGWFDVVQDYEIALALIGTAEKWAAQQGMEQIHGPLFYNTLGKQGMLVEGFENVPQATTIYNYPYYPEFLERMGFVKEYDFLQYKVNANVPTERLAAIAERIRTRNNLVSMNVEDLKKDPARVKQFLQTYSDVFSRSVYNFIPFTEKEMQQEAAEVIPMLRNEYCSVLCEQNGDIAAFGICFPSLSAAMQKAKGKLFPLGWYHILKALKCNDNPVSDLMIIGAAEKWEGKGITAIIHSDLAQRRKNLKIEYNITNPQIEDNKAVNVWSTYDNDFYMRRRVYIKNID